MGGFVKAREFIEEVTDFVTLHMPFVYPWTWVLLLWLMAKGFLHWWLNREESAAAQAGDKREFREFLRLFTQVCLGLFSLSLASFILVLGVKLFGSGLLAFFALLWWSYFGLGFVRPRARLQRRADHAAALTLVGVAILFQLYINATGPSYYLGRLTPKGATAQRYVAGLAAAEKLSPGQLLIFLNSEQSNLRANTIGYLSQTKGEPSPKVIERVVYLTEHDREEFVRGLALTFLADLRSRESLSEPIRKLL